MRAPFRGLALLLGSLLAAACGGDRASLTVAAGTPIVLVSVDTLRSDRLPIYGYDGVSTPALDALRRDAILFERAYCHVPLTLPSHSSLLTGLLPPRHGVRDNLGYVLDAGTLPYLPRLLRDRGYATGAFVSAFVLRADTGLDAGFDVYDDRVGVREGAALGELQRPGGETLERALDWLGSVGERPFFLFLHLYEPHSPYEPPEPFASAYESAYDGEVAAADAVVGRLLAWLRERDLYEDALLLFLSDHGEGLGDHGEQEHEILLYREVLQVPLLLKLPGRRLAGESVSAPAQLIDVLPTVLRLVGTEPPPGLEGTSLLALGQPSEDRPLYAESFYARLHLGWSELVSLVRGPYHLVDGPRPELFHLLDDPAERDDLAGRERRLVASLQEELNRRERTLAAPSGVDPETRERLAALGYVGHAAGGSDDAAGLADPRERLHVLADLKRAFALHAQGRHEPAVEAFRRVLAEEEGMVDAWEHLGKSLHQLGRGNEALEAYRRALELSGGAPHVALSAAELLLQLGRLDEAEAHARLAVTVHGAAHELLARIALERGDVVAAEDESARAVARLRDQPGPLVTRARVLVRAGRGREALDLLEGLDAGAPGSATTAPPPGLHVVRGQAYAQLGDTGLAATAFEREIDLFPAAPEGYTHLAYLHAVEGRAREAGAALRRLVEANPTPAAYAAAVLALRAMGDPSSAGAVLREARRRWPEDEELRKLAG